MSEAQDTCTSRIVDEQVSLPLINTINEISDPDTLALAAELELDVGTSTTSEQEASESEDAPPQADEVTMTITEQVVEHVVTTKEVVENSPSAPQWTPVNPGPRPTKGGKGIKQVGGDYVGPSQSARSPMPGDSDDESIEIVVDHETNNVAVGNSDSSESDEDEQSKAITPGYSEDDSADNSEDMSTTAEEAAPSSEAALKIDSTPSSPQDSQQATDHPKTGGKGPMIRAPLKLEKLKTETAERMKSHLASAGLDTKGTKKDLMARILLSENGLDLQMYFPRCLVLLSTTWSLRQLKDRCTELGVPVADRKTSSKPKLAQLLLLAEREQGIVFADGDNGPKTSAWSAPKKTKAPQPGDSTTSTPAERDLKRKHDDSTDTSEDESPDTKRAKSDESESPNGNGHGNSTPRASTPRPKKAPKKRQVKGKTVTPEDNENSNVGTNPPAESSAPATNKIKRKRTGEDEADQDGYTNSKRTKRHDSWILAAAASKKAPTSQIVKQAMIEKPPTKTKVHLSIPYNVTNVAFGIPDKVDSSKLFEDQPVPIDVADAAYRILSGRSTEGDATKVHFHRLHFPKYQNYIKQHVDKRSDDDKRWLNTKKFWEVYEMKAVCESIGEDYVDGAFENEMLYEEPIGMTVRDYYRLLKDPEGDERMTKEEKEESRDKLMRCAVLGTTPVADPAFKIMRNGSEARWPGTS